MTDKPIALIVEDSVTVRMDLDDAMHTAGFDVLHAADIATAERTLDGSAVELVLLDVSLPDGDGLELLARIRADARHAETKVIVLSSHDDVADRVRGLHAGADDYAGKPYDREYVISRSRELAGLRGRDNDAQKLILIIEDSQTFANELRETFGQAGYRTVVATHGEEGIRRAAQHRPHLIVVDGQLPDIDGPTVAQRLRIDPSLRDTPIVMLTGTLDQAGQVRALAQGIDAYIRKDQGLDLVLARVSMLLRTLHGGASEAVTSAYGAKRLLAVDDSATYRHALRDALHEIGYDVVLASSGEQALALLAVQVVDCVLLDVEMPGMGGLETCRRIKRSPAWRSTPVLLLSGTEAREAMLRGIDSGADDYISKAAGHDVVRARVQAHVRRREQEADSRRIRDEIHKREIEAAQERSRRELAEARAALVDQIEAQNLELRAKNQQLHELSEALTKTNGELRDFTYFVSHDLQTPLRATRRFAEILVEEKSDLLDEEGLEFLDFVIGGTRRMTNLVRDLLHYSRVSNTPLKKRPVDVNGLVDGILMLIEGDIEAAGATITRGDLPSVDGHEPLLSQLFENLLGNAIKYRADRPLVVEVSAEQTPDETIFAVADNGQGIAPASLERVFQIFQRLQPRDETSGTGIGLAICRKVAVVHGGRIWVESKPGVGSTFKFALPHGGGDG